MVLTKDELINALQNEMRILHHLASKVDPAKLDYRPTPKQRSLLELLQYMTIVGPIHLRACLADAFDREAWGNTWRTEEAAAKVRNLEAVKAAIAKQPGLFAELLSSCTDRGSMIVSLVLCHFAAYRMQLFLYLKACGREELSTLNLWAGMDAAS
ncbi:MAG: hypothetical protein DMG58_35465 [Acidobacteria bacterium]|nr:MAG: hypothetical protein DMG58_35465 [Acidobacteriota bacterium]